MTDLSTLLVSTDELAARLGEPNLRVVDGSWYLPTAGRDAEIEYEVRRIPGAVRFDIDAVAITDTDLPHMLPSADTFAEKLGALGLSETDEIVVYDGAGLLSAPRVWWSLKAYGAENVRILDGGLPKWMDEKRPLDKTDPAPPTPAVFRATRDPARFADMEAVARALADGSATVVDARPAERFRGEAPEPRPGVPSGHMPGALGVAAATVVAGTRLADPDAVRAAFAAVDLTRPIVCSCGSGVTAAILWFALESIGVSPEAMRLYDGSWSEWATRGGAIVTGA